MTVQYIATQHPAVNQCSDSCSAAPVNATYVYMNVRGWGIYLAVILVSHHLDTAGRVKRGEGSRTWPTGCSTTCPTCRGTYPTH